MSRTPHARPAGQPGPEPNQVILGVDTHKDVHVAAVSTTLGVQLADATFPTTSTGYQQLLDRARGFGVLDRAGVEGTGSYGAAPTRFLRRHQVTVIEVNRPARRRHGKTDTIDAAAHAVLSQRATTTAKTADGTGQERPVATVGCWWLGLSGCPRPFAS